jgi:hypothetical protein
MRSECLAALPQSFSSYAWKVPPARPALFDRAQSLLTSSGEQSAREAPQAGHPSVPWKAYLASREFQHLSSDLAEALFAAALPDTVPDAVRPASLAISEAALAAKDGNARSGLLAAILPGSDADSQAAQDSEQPGDLALAA